MRRRESWRTFATGPKKPPPAHGIKMKKAGTTWWGQRWIEALQQVLKGDSGRLARGRTYARAGRTHDLVIAGGKVTAKVTGSRATPYKITIALGQFPEATWKAAVAGMAAKAQFSAELLAGRMPREIDEVFRAARTSLFPAARGELVTSCSCPDWGDPCKHVAATHYVLGEALDRDPFLLFELRSRTREQVLEALREARGASGERDGAVAKAPGGEPQSPTKARKTTRAATALPTTKAETKPKPKPKAVAPAGARTPEAVTTVPAAAAATSRQVDPRDYDRLRQALPAMHFSFEAPTSHGALLRQLGAPAAWSADGSPADSLAPLVREAAAAARRLALGAPEPAPSSGKELRRRATVARPAKR